jgi:hypothetical protein
MTSMPVRSARRAGSFSWIVKPLLGAMPDGLSVTADGGDLVYADTASGKGPLHGARVQVGELERNGAGEIEAILSRLAQVQDAFAQLGAEWDGGECERARGCRGEFDQRRVGTVEAGAGHETHEERHAIRSERRPPRPPGRGWRPR